MDARSLAEHLRPPLMIMAMSAALGGIIALLFPNPFAFTFLPSIRSWLVLTVIVLCTFVPLLTHRKSVSTILVVMIPFVAQFYEIILGWDVEGGATSALRLLPFGFMAAALVLSITRDRPRLTLLEIGTLCLWVVSCLISYVASYGVVEPDIALNAFLLHAGLLPLIYWFVKGRVQNDAQGAHQILAALVLGFLLLAWGAIAVSFVALTYRSSASLLVARNANDSNNVIGYLLLAWPFVTLAMSVWHKKMLWALLVTFLAAIAVMFSRGGLLLVPPLMLLTAVLMTRRLGSWGLTLGVVAISVGLLWTWLATRIDLVEMWRLRLDFDPAVVQGFGGVASLFSFQSSERGAIWLEASRIFGQEPLWGYGFGSFEVLGPGFSEAHSLLFTTLAERGLVGVLLVYGIIGASLLSLLVNISGSKHEARRFLLVASASFVCWLAYVHVVNSALVVLSQKGFMVNVLGAMLLIIFLHAKRFRPEVAAV